MTIKTLKLAMEKAAELPEAAQEKIGREVLEYWTAWRGCGRTKSRREDCLAIAPRL
jgi:hypothetical protein